MRSQPPRARAPMTFPRTPAMRVDVVLATPGMKLAHPIDGLLKPEGSAWTADQFTFALLREGSILRAEDVPPPAPAHIEPVASERAAEAALEPAPVVSTPL